MESYASKAAAQLSEIQAVFPEECRDLSQVRPQIHLCRTRGISFREVGLEILLHNVLRWDREAHRETPQRLSNQHVAIIDDHISEAQFERHYDRASSRL